MERDMVKTRKSVEPEESVLRDTREVTELCWKLGDGVKKAA